MILSAAKTAACFALAALAAMPARADVMQIDGGEARWVAGPGALTAAPAGPAQALEEVPAEVALTANYAARDVGGSSRAAVPDAYAAKVTELAARFDLSPALIEALVWQESRWRSDARSTAGARGLAQLMPGTARDLGVNPDDPFANLEGGARYLREQIDRFDGDIEKALAAYNAGPGRVTAAGGIPNIRETRQYVSAIMGRLSDHSRSSN